MPGMTIRNGKRTVTPSVRKSSRLFEDYQGLKREEKKEAWDAIGKGASLLTSIPALQSGNAMLEGSAKIGIGYSLASEEVAKFVGAKIAPTVGALGGVFGIAGLSQISTSILPSYASLPISAIGGYAVGAKAFSGILGISETAAGAIGAGLGIGFGIFGMLQGRREEKKRLTAEAEEREFRVEQADIQLRGYRDILPLLDDQLGQIQKQRERNLSIIKMNMIETERLNEMTNRETQRTAKKAMGNFRMNVAFAGLSGVGSSWYLAGEIDDYEARKYQEAGHQAAVTMLELENKREEVEDQATAALRDVAYMQMKIGTQIDYTQSLLKRNLLSLESNKYAGPERVGRARAALSLGGAVETLVSAQTEKAKGAYYNYNRYW
jgi:hypothetical protein